MSRRRRKSGVTGSALVACSALVLALGGCTNDSASDSGSASESGSESGYSEVVQVSGTSTQTRGITWTTEASDPRVSGDSENDPNCELTEDGDRTIGICTATSTLTNDGGAWEGGCTGTTTWTLTEPDHIHDFDCTMVGTGDYLGLRYRFNIGGGNAMPWESTGQIETFPTSTS